MAYIPAKFANTHTLPREISPKAVSRAGFEMAPVEVDADGDWLGLHKKIGAVTLWICAMALGGNVVWLLVKSRGEWLYDAEDMFLVAGIVLVMALAAALMRSITYAAEIEREQMRTSVELQRSQASLRAVVKSMPVGVVVVDAPSGRLIMANDQHEQLLRYMLVPGATLWEQCGRKAYHMDGRPYTYSDWPIAKTIHAGETVLDQEIWTERGDGSRICLSINAAPIFDGDGVISAAVIAFTDVTEHKEIAEERAMLARRLINAQEEERLRLARELHDEMGQDLTALSLGLKALETLDDLHDLRCSARGIRKIVEHMSVQVHQTAATLRPMLLSHLGLRQAIEDLVMTWSERLSIPADVHLEALSDPLNDEAATTIYRVVQEALTNIAKHSRASGISVTARKSDNLLRVVVEDDGKGFDCEIVEGDRSGRYGLSGMRERLALVGGDFTVESALDRGTTVYVSLPSTARLVEAGVP